MEAKPWCVSLARVLRFKSQTTEKSDGKTGRASEKPSELSSAASKRDKTSPTTNLGHYFTTLLMFCGEYFHPHTTPVFFRCPDTPPGGDPGLFRLNKPAVREPRPPEPRSSRVFCPPGQLSQRQVGTDFHLVGQKTRLDSDPRGLGSDAPGRKERGSEPDLLI